MSGYSTQNKSLTIGIIAGEVSGDILSAGLMKQIKIRHPNVRFVGIGGEKMLKEGLISLYSIDELSVMGLEILRKLFRILKIRRNIVSQILDYNIDLFVGVDSPDFNLYVEEKIKKKGIPTVHYVCPSVWAWRQNRIYKIKEATNLVLSLLPFEKEFCDKFNTPCVFVGHTLADQIPLESDKLEFRKKLNLPTNKNYIALLPGSRHGEVISLSPIFLQACQLLKNKKANFTVLVPLVNEKRKRDFDLFLEKFGDGLDIRLFDGNARDVMAASDVVILSSGTATLECMLVGRPMIVGYKLAKFSEFIARRLIKVKYVSLPNLLLNRNAVPELLQDDCTPEKICSNVETILNSDLKDLLSDFKKCHFILKQDADEKAASACLDLIK